MNYEKSPSKKDFEKGFREIAVELESNGNMRGNTPQNINILFDKAMYKISKDILKYYGVNYKNSKIDIRNISKSLSFQKSIFELMQMKYYGDKK